VSWIDPRHQCSSEIETTAGEAFSNSDVGDELTACETVLDIVGDLFTHGRQLKHLIFDDRIVGLLSKLPILGCFIPEIVGPFHVVQSGPCPRISGPTRLREHRRNPPPGRRQPLR